jgi:hypothetical protein
MVRMTIKDPETGGLVEVDTDDGPTMERLAILRDLRMTPPTAEDIAAALEARGQARVTERAATEDDRLRFTSLTDFLDEDEPEEEWLVAGIIPVASLFQFLGKPESFKSMGLLSLHVSAAYGSPWLGRAVRAMPSFYVSNEKRRRSVRERLALMTGAQSGQREHDLTVIHRTPLRIHPKDTGWLRLVEAVDAVNAEAMVSLDTITSLAPAGFKENDGASWAEVLDAVRMLTSLAHPATVLGSFHPAKADGGGVAMSSRGHGSFDGEADGALTFNRPDRRKDEGVIHARPKDGEYRVIPFEWNPATRLIEPKDLTGLVLTATTVVDVVRSLGNPTWQDVQMAYGKDPAGRCRFGEDKVREVLMDATGAGMLVRGRENATDPYRWSIPEEAE